jgi:hypothetical protein
LQFLLLSQKGEQKREKAWGWASFKAKDKKAGVSTLPGRNFRTIQKADSDSRQIFFIRKFRGRQLLSGKTDKEGRLR